MLTTSRKQLIEKVIARDGIVYRVIFAISNDFGRVKAEIIRAVPIGTIEENAEILAIPEAKKTKIYGEVLETVFAESFVSVYSNLIFINGSKPRAPTLH